MKLFTAFLTLPLIVFSAVFFVSPILARADTGLINVTFESTPLFANGDIKPGDRITKTVTVKNLSQSPQNVYLELLNCAETKDLGDTLFMSVGDGTTTYLSNTSFADLFCNIKKPLTSALGAGASATYQVTIDFPWEAGNEYQLGSAGFDFCVGFSGGAFGCDGSTSGGGDIIIPTGGSGDDGPSSGGRRRLTIFNERPESVDNPGGSADLLWNTNLPATSKAVCRPSGTSVVFDLGDTDDFGYPILLPEDSALIETHLLEMSGLAPGTYYCRVASRLGPGQGWTVSNEFPFVIRAGAPETGSVPSPFGVSSASASVAGGAGTRGGVGATAGAGGGDTSPSVTETGSPEETNAMQDFAQAAAAFLGLPNLDDLFNFGVCGCDWWVWVVVGIFLLIATLWRERFIYAIGIVPEAVRRFWVFAGLGIFVIILALIFDWLCLYVPLSIGTATLLFAGVVDLIFKKRARPVYRLLYDIGAIAGGLLVALIMVFFAPWLCSIVPLVLLLLLMLVRFLWHWFRMSKKDEQV